MTAGVQNIDQAAHLPPPSSASTSDSKGISAPGKQTSDAPGKFQDFQIELALLGGGPQETESGGGPAPRAFSLTGSAKLGSAKPGAAKSGSVKSGSVKFGKKRDARADETNLAAPTPVQVVEPQKQILPLAPVLTKLDENAMPGDNAKLDESSTLDKSIKLDGGAQASTQPNELANGSDCCRARGGQDCGASAIRRAAVADYARSLSSSNSSGRRRDSRAGRGSGTEWPAQAVRQSWRLLE